VRALALASVAALLVSCGSHAAEPTPTNLHTATLITQTRTPTPTSAGGSPEVLSGSALIEVGDRFFVPPQLIIAAGTTVMWVNRGQEEHTASARDGSFGSSSLGFGNSYSFTFTKPGIYAYYCMNHGDMRGQVEVR
jgi:plastocyanin